MRVLSIDLSSHSGVAYFDTKQQDLLIDCFDYAIKQKTPMATHKVEKGNTKRKSKRKRMVEKYDPSNHPKDFLEFVSKYIDGLYAQIERFEPEIVVIEQTNKGRDRWRQKLIEWLHYDLCIRLLSQTPYKIRYINTIEWREILSIKMSRDERKANKIIRKHNKEAQTDKKIKRITGITSSKTLAVDYVKSRFNLNIQNKHHDIADAICLGVAYLIKEGEIDA